MPVRLATRDAGFEPAFQQLLDATRESAADVDAAVAAIIEDVVRRGDAALIDHTRRFDNVELPVSGLRVTRGEIAGGAAAASPETVAALRLAAERIESFHRRQLPPAIDYVDALGVRLANRWRPIAAAGLYVPGGTAAYPSSVLMNAIPAKVAGVERLVMTVPAPGGVLNPLVLAAAELVGIDEIYRVGGAQAIAALAFGTATIAPVDKIVGPGNAYVAAAKRRVFGRVGIDMIAGPSEILVVADGVTIRNGLPPTYCRKRSTTVLRKRSLSPTMPPSRSRSRRRSRAIWRDCRGRRLRGQAGRRTARSSWSTIGKRRPY